MAPERTWLPPEKIILPPVPLMTPARVPVAVLIVSTLAPKAVLPEPVRLLTLAPEVVALMSKIPPLLTPLELAMLPEPDSARVPELMVVTPV